MSLATATVIGAGGLPDQAEAGIAHVILFPDQTSTREYLGWYERASADGGDGGYMSDPILRVCNAAVVAGGGVYKPEKVASARELRKIATALVESCGNDAAVEPVGGKRA